MFHVNTATENPGSLYMGDEEILVGVWQYIHKSIWLYIFYVRFIIY